MTVRLVECEAADDDWYLAVLLLLLYLCKPYVF
jgi:hypothetical protein